MRLFCLSLCVLTLCSYVFSTKTETETDKSIKTKVTVQSAELVSLDAKNVVRVKKKKLKNDDQTKFLELGE